jgi:hypothetical protein
LVEDGDAAEPAVDVARVLHLLGEQCDGLSIDGAGDGQPGLEFVRLVVLDLWWEAEFLVCAAVDVSEQSPVARLAYGLVPVLPSGQFGLQARCRHDRQIERFGSHEKHPDDLLGGVVEQLPDGFELRGRHHPSSQNNRADLRS